jgi:transcriptional regulator with XRE-family HTH domain
LIVVKNSQDWGSLTSVSALPVQEEPRRELTPLGGLLEDARASLGISIDKAGQRARITRQRWSQVVTGRQPKAGRLVPVNPRPRTVVAMALAVGVDPDQALTAAGISVDDTSALVEDVRRELAEPAAPTTDDDLAEEIERIGKLRLPPDQRLRIIRAIVKVYEEQQGTPDGD